MMPSAAASISCVCPSTPQACAQEGAEREGEIEGTDGVGLRGGSQTAGLAVTLS